MPTTHDDDLMTAKAAIEVHAGLIPGQPLDEFTQHWWITSEEWQKAQEETEALVSASDDWNYKGALPTAQLLIDKQGPAQAYAAYLMLQPDLVNWVKCEWVWF